MTASTRRSATLAALLPTVSLLSMPGAALAGGPPQGQVYDLRPVVVEGAAVPQLGGGTSGIFESFGLPALNADGQIAFVAQTANGAVSSGAWTTPVGDPTGLELVAGAGTVVPGGGTISWMQPFLEHIELIDDGRIGFRAPLSGVAGGGLFLWGDGVLDTVVRPGDPVSGIGGATFANVSRRPALSDGGLFAFRATLDGPGVDEDSDEAIFVEWFGGPTPLVREGAAAFGLPGTTWAPRLATEPQIAANGRVSFATSLDDGLDTHAALWTGFPGALELAVREGTDSPFGVDYGRPFQPPLGAGSWSAGDGGRLATAIGLGDADANGRSIMRFTGDDDAHVIAARVTPGDNDYAAIEGSLSMSQTGSVAFRGTFAGAPASADTAVLLGHPLGGVTLQLLEGDQAFGMGASVVFDDFSQGTTLAVDDAGRIFLRTSVRGPGITELNDTGIWMVEADGTVNLVARGQQGVLVGPWDVRRIVSVNFTQGSGTGSGRRPAINDRGDIAFVAYFDDGTEAILHGHLPPVCPADRDGDGFVTFDDLLIVLAAFDQPAAPVGSSGDANFDGTVDFDDLLIVLAAFGSACQPV